MFTHDGLRIDRFWLGTFLFLLVVEWAGFRLGTFLSLLVVEWAGSGRARGRICIVFISAIRGRSLKHWLAVSFARHDGTIEQVDVDEVGFRYVWLGDLRFKEPAERECDRASGRERA